MNKFSIAVATLLLALASFAQVGFTISPPKYEFTVKPNESKTFTINVQNTTDSVLHVKVYPNDWLVNTESEMKYFPASTLKNSCSGWIYINPQEFNIQPKSAEDVRFTMNVPNDVYGDYWSMLFFESTPFNFTGSDMIMLAGRVGCTIYATIAGTTSKNGDIVGLDFDKKDYRVKAVFENTGSVHVRVKGFLQIFKEDKMVYEKTVESRLSLPESKTNIYFPVETELQKGEYILRVNLDYSGSEILEGEKRITIN